MKFVKEKWQVVHSKKLLPYERHSEYEILPVRYPFPYAVSDFLKRFLPCFLSENIEKPL